MTWIYQGFEVAATLCENIIVLYAVTEIAGNKYQKNKQFLYILLVSVFFSVFISILNIFSLFSFMTIAVSFTTAILLSKITSKGPLLLRTLACLLVYLVIHAIDYILLFSFCFVLETPVVDAFSFSVLLGASPQRLSYLVLNKILDASFFFALRKALPELQRLSNKYIWRLLSISLSIYITMTILIGLIMARSLFAMQTAIMLS